MQWYLGRAHACSAESSLQGGQQQRRAAPLLGAIAHTGKHLLARSTPICFHRRARGAQCLSPRLLRKALPIYACGHRRLHKESRSRASGFQNGASSGCSLEPNRQSTRRSLLLSTRTTVLSSKASFKQKLDYFDVDKVVSRGHAYFVERAIRTLKEALLRRISAGLAARNRWHQLLPDVLAQYNSRTHGGTGVAPDQAYSDPAKAEHARQVMQTQAKRNAPPRPFSCSWRSGEGQGQASGKQRSLPSYRNSLDRTELPYHSNRTFRHGSAVHSGRVAQRQASRSRTCGKR